MQKKAFIFSFLILFTGILQAQNRVTSPIARITLRKHHVIVTMNWGDIPLEYDDARGEISYGGVSVAPYLFAVNAGVLFTRFRDESDKATFGKLQSMEGAGGRIIFDYYSGENSPLALIGKLKWIQFGVSGDRMQFSYDEKTGKPTIIDYKRERMLLEYFADFTDRDLAGKLHNILFLNNNCVFEYYNSEGDGFSHGNLYSLDFNNNKVLFEYDFDRIRPLGVCMLPVFMEIK